MPSIDEAKAGEVTPPGLGIPVMLALLVGITFLSWASSGSSTEIDILRERVKVLQERFRVIALAYDVAIIDGLQNYPPPDFEVRSRGETAMDEEYDRLIRLLGTRRADPARATRVSNERRSLHFDALALLSDHDRDRGHLSDNLTAETLKELHQYRVFRDPFAPNCQLGYISTYQDYWLISVGPNRRPDILGFMQHGAGHYKVTKETFHWFEPTASELAELGANARTRFHGTPYDSFDFLDIISPDLIYDPTNGAFSDGDIVFKRRGGDDWLFSYPGLVQLKPINLIPKGIEEVIP